MHRSGVRCCVSDAFEFYINDNTYSARLINLKNNIIRVEIDAILYEFNIVKEKQNFFIHNESLGNITISELDRFPEVEKQKQKGAYESPMPSQVVKLLVNQGDKIKSGEGLIVLSSMKMENTILANEDGTVEEIYTQEGENIEAGHLLMKITN